MPVVSMRVDADLSPNNWFPSGAIPHWQHVSNDPYNDFTKLSSWTMNEVETFSHANLDPGLDFGEMTAITYRVRVAYASIEPTEPWHGIEIALYKDGDGSPFVTKYFTLPDLVSSPTNIDLVLGSGFALTRSQCDSFIVRMKHNGTFDPFMALVQVSEIDLLGTYSPSKMLEGVTEGIVSSGIVRGKIGSQTTEGKVSSGIVKGKVSSGETVGYVSSGITKGKTGGELVG